MQHTHTPHTHTTENAEILNVYNLTGYPRNCPRFIAGRNKYDVAGRWNSRGIFTIRLMELDQVFIDCDGLYTIGKYIKHWPFNGHIPEPETF